MPKGKTLSVKGTCMNAFIICSPLLNIHCFPDAMPTLHCITSSNKVHVGCHFQGKKHWNFLFYNNNDMILLIMIMFFLCYWIVLCHSTYVNFLLLYCLFEHYIIDTVLLDLELKKEKHFFVIQYLKYVGY